MDILVTSVQQGSEWLLTDLLGRAMGVIVKTEGGAFQITPDGNAKATMTGMRNGPFSSLDDALATIETHTRGVCRRVPGADQS